MNTSWEADPIAPARGVLFGLLAGATLLAGLTALITWIAR